VVTNPDPTTSSLEIVQEILNQRLQKVEIENILRSLGSGESDPVYTQLGDVLRKTSALLEISRRVSESLSLDHLLPRIGELVTEFMNAERATIFLQDWMSGELFSIVAMGDLKQEIRIGTNTGIAGSVFSTGQPLIVADAYNDPRFHNEVDRTTGFRTRNLICAPIKHRGRVIGVIQVINKKDLPFTDADLRLLCSLSAHASGGFENARLHAQVAHAREQEGKLLDVTTAMSRELHLKPLLQKIMNTVTIFLEADRSTLFLHDEQTDELWSEIAQGSNEIRFPAHLGIAGSVFKSGEVINIPDAYSDARFNPSFDKRSGYRTSTILCMPVGTKTGRTIGVIQVINKKDGAFTRQDERRLRAFSAQASIAIENAKMFEEIIEVKNYTESILESMSNGVITIDAEGCVVTANQAALKLFGSKTDLREIAGRPTDQIFSGRNQWVTDSVETVTSTSDQDIALDMDLHLPLGSSSFTETTSVNLSTIPLRDARGHPMGCLLMLEDISTEKRLRGTMARYIPKELADRLLEGEENALGGNTLTATVLFSDIRSFTTISERLGAEETVALLNDYFSVMVDLISENDGILDKFIGDAIMAVYGAPFPGPRDADNAVKTAIEMMHALARFNTRREAAGKETLRIGIGINTGEVVSGNIGSSKRMDYTIIGDGVNVGSRLEQVTKVYGAQILISEFTHSTLADPSAYVIRPIDCIRVQGKAEPVWVYEVLDYYTQSRETIDRLIAHFCDALRHYRDRSWETAMRCFQHCALIMPGDRPSRVFWNRCRYFMEHPPAPDWDGVWTLRSK